MLRLDYSIAQKLKGSKVQKLKISKAQKTRKGKGGKLWQDVLLIYLCYKI